MGLPAYQERFEILGEIGEGGFARVWRAREKTTGRKVALKVLKDAYRADQEIVERFRREVFAVSSISSPHVVGLHDFGISGDEIYIAMEFVEGPTLRDLIYERAWTRQEIHLIIGQIAQALSAAHRQNIVHRDLKPENVMLVPGPGGARMCKVLDFGLAKLAELERKLELEPLTRAGMCFGTPQYMAPELIQGRPFDKSVDLYALAVIAFEMLAGYLPWDGGDPREVLLAVVKNPAPHIKQMHPSLKNPVAVDTFIQRALSKDKSLRPADAVTFFRELESALFGAEKPPRVASTVPREDAVFATVWAASLDLRTETPVEERTQIDGGPRFDTPLETTSSGQGPHGFGGGPTRSGLRRKKLMSGWMKGLSHDEITAPDPQPDLADTLPVGAKVVPVVPSASSRPIVTPAPARTPVKPLYTGKTDATEMITDPGARPRQLYLWLVPLLLGLVTFAAALGYFLGRQAN